MKPSIFGRPLAITELARDSRRELEASSIGRLCLSLYPRDPLGRLFMISTAYFDESGTHGGSPLTVVAGLVGQVEHWAHLEREWQKVLRKHGLTHVRAKHLFHRQKQFKGWRERQITHLWADMMYVIQEHREIFVAKTVLLEEDYKIFYVSDGPAKKERLDSRYALCFRALLSQHPLIHRNFHKSGSVNFVLESGHRNAGDAMRVFNEIKNDKDFLPREALGFLSFGSKQDSPALQAADALAYWLFRTEVANLQEPEYFETSPMEAELDEMGIGIIGSVITPADLTNLRKNFLRKNKKPTFLTLSLGDFPLADPTSKYWHDYETAPPLS